MNYRRNRVRIILASTYDEKLTTFDIWRGHVLLNEPLKLGTCQHDLSTVQQNYIYFDTSLVKNGQLRKP